jgi:excisionase family DNA binding protein
MVLPVVLAGLATVVLMNIQDNAQGSRTPAAPLLSVQQAAHVLGVSRSTLTRLVMRGQLQPVRIGRRVLIDPDDVERLIWSNRESERQS